MGRAVHYVGPSKRSEAVAALLKQGCEIAVCFRITSGGTADQLLQDCATQDGEHFYHADNQSELLEAFDAIGTGIGQLRITH